MVEASQVTTHAVDQATPTNQVVEGLASATPEIGHAVQLIKSIAGKIASVQAATASGVRPQHSTLATS